MPSGFDWCDKCREWYANVFDSCPNTHRKPKAPEKLYFGEPGDRGTSKTLGQRDAIILDNREKINEIIDFLGKRG